MFAPRQAPSPPSAAAVATEAAPDGSLLFVSASTIGHRPDMEDEHILAVPLLRGRVWLSAVFDGHGGYEVAYFIRTSLVNALCCTNAWMQYDRATASDDNESEADAHLLGEAVSEALCVCEKHVLTDLATLAGSTAIVVLVTPRHIVTVNVGDSRACLLRSTGIVQTLSRDHKPLHAAETERILRAGGRIDRAENRVELPVSFQSGTFIVSLAMSRAVGDRAFKLNTRFPPREQCVACIPEVSVVPRGSGQLLLLLASDGVWDAFPDPPLFPASGASAMRALCTILQTTTGDTPAALRAFLRECVDRTAPTADNATAILIRACGRPRASGPQIASSAAVAVLNPFS